MEKKSINNINFYYNKKSIIYKELCILMDKIKIGEIDIPYKKQHQLFNFFKFKMGKTNNILNIKNTNNIKIFKYENKTFFFKYQKNVLNKKNKNLVIISPGLTSFSNDLSESNSSYYFIFKFLPQNTNTDFIIFYRDYIDIDGNFNYECFDSSYNFKIFLNYLKDSDLYNFDNIYLVGISAGCYTLLKYLNDNNNLVFNNIRSCLLISCSPNIKNNLQKLNIINSKFLKNNLIKKINNFKNNYDLKNNISITDCIGTIGKINFNLSNINDYYEHLKMDISKFNTKIPIIFLNSLDDDISNYNFILDNKILDLINYNKNIHFIISKTGWHGTFYNDNYDFLSEIILTIFNLDN